MAETMAYFSNKNRKRIQAVESTFGRSGKSLLRPDRVLVGEGRLLKFCRRGPKPKVFFLFNDILVYASIMVPGRWNNKKKIISLEEVQQEDLEDNVAMANQWLIRTPRKSFYVAAASPEEKQQWMKHIEHHKALLLQKKGLPNDSTGKRNFAATWVPDIASAICMRCSDQFTVANRRHHCRRCGFIVCGACSKYRVLLLNISSRPVRVCQHCANHLNDQDGQKTRRRKFNAKKWTNSLEDSPPQPEYESSSEEELDEDSWYQVPTKWFGSQPGSRSEYCYINPEHKKPPVSGL